MAKILFKNVRKVLSQGIERKDVLIESLEGEDETIDCSGEGLYLLPGLVDAHVHFREPGLTQKGSFETESEAALAGGVTMIFDMPNTKPATITYEDFKAKVELAREKCKCQFKLFMGVGAGGLGEVVKVLKDSNVSEFLAGVKIYMGHSTGDMGSEGSVLEEVLSLPELRDVPVVVHAEDQGCLDQHEGEFSLEDPGSHSRARPVECGVEAVKEACHLARKYNRKIHIAHVSSREELDVISKFRDGGLVTCEVSPHHLFLNEDDYERAGHLLKVNPPVRSKDEALELWKALVGGEIDIIATDHSPHTLEEKEGDVPPSGMPEVQTLLPLLLNEVNEGRLALKDIVRLCHDRPLEIFGAQGTETGWVLVDMNKEWIVKREDLKYKCGWSPYEGRVLKGSVRMIKSPTK